MKYGDKVEISFWLAGGETPEHIKQFMADAELACQMKAKAAKVMIGPPEFSVKLPGGERVPAVPKWLEAKCISEGRKTVSLSLSEGKAETWTAPVLLVAEATVYGRKPQFNKRTFVGDLSQKDLASLRKATRKVIKRPLTDIECDDIIEQIGPGAAFDSVMSTIGAGATKH